MTTNDELDAVVFVVVCTWNQPSGAAFSTDINEARRCLAALELSLKPAYQWSLVDGLFTARGR